MSVSLDPGHPRVAFFRRVTSEWGFLKGFASGVALCLMAWLIDYAHVSPTEKRDANFRIGNQILDSLQLKKVDGRSIHLHYSDAPDEWQIAAFAGDPQEPGVRTIRLDAESKVATVSDGIAPRGGPVDIVLEVIIVPEGRAITSSPLRVKSIGAARD